MGSPDIENEDVSPDFNDPESSAANSDGDTVPAVNSNLPIWDRIAADKFASVEEALAWRLFNTDICTLLSMTSLWENRPERKRPNVLDIACLEASTKHRGTLFPLF